MTLEYVAAGFAVINAVGIGGLWFKLGAALESNTLVHTRLDSLTQRVRDLEVRQTEGFEHA